MYYEYHDIYYLNTETNKRVFRRFFDMGAAQAYARQLGKDKIPYRWELFGCEHYSNPKRNCRSASWHIMFLNGTLGHPTANEYLEFYNGHGYDQPWEPYTYA